MFTFHDMIVPALRKMHAGEPADGCGHERRVLFVPTYHELRAHVGQDIEDRIDLCPRYAEDVFHTVCGKGFHHTLSASPCGRSH